MKGSYLLDVAFDLQRDFWFHVISLGSSYREVHFNSSFVASEVKSRTGLQNFGDKLNFCSLATIKHKKTVHWGVSRLIFWIATTI